MSLMDTKHIPQITLMKTKGDETCGMKRDFVREI